MLRLAWTVVPPAPEAGLDLGTQVAVQERHDHHVETERAVRVRRDGDLDETVAEVIGEVTHALVREYILATVPSRLSAALETASSSAAIVRQGLARRWLAALGWLLAA